VTWLALVGYSFIVVFLRYDVIVGKALIILSKELARRIQSCYDKHFFAVMLFCVILKDDVACQFRRQVSKS